MRGPALPRHGASFGDGTESRPLSRYSPNPPRGAVEGGRVVLTWLTARLASCQARREPECFAPPSGWNDGARLFALTLFVYPLALALLCLGAGLLVDRCSGRFLPAALLPSVG